ncbi:MAG: hypothetical protein MAG794_00973 [Gammaproteobacteria bacterium]|nr:hypothetical protein [Gammaproteobacteria bacterium]
MHLQPLLVGLPLFQTFVNPFRRQELAVACIHRDHLSGPQAPFGLYVGGVVVMDAGFRSQGDHPVVGDGVAGRPQAIAVQNTGRESSVGHDDTGGAVPGLHMHRIELVKRPQIRIDTVEVLPGRRHHHPGRQEYIHAAHHQNFEHVVDAGGIRIVPGYQRPDGVYVRDERRVELVAAGVRPVAVALNGIDLSVVGQESKRLGEPPLRQGVGGKALMEYAQRRFQSRVGEIRVQHGQQAGHDQPFVQNQPRRQAVDVKHRVFTPCLFFRPSSGDEQLSFESLDVYVGSCIDEQLLDDRQHIQCLCAECGRVYGYTPPAGEPQALTRKFFFD